MNKKMSFLKFCRRSLTALPVFLLFFACDKILPPSGNGVDIPVKVRAVSIAGGAQNEIVRAGGEKRIVGEPIIQNLGDGMLAEITVEEDLSALRDNKLLENDAKFRIIALNEGTSTIYSWADYTAASSGTLNPVAGNLHVVSDVEYDFVCYSFNTSSTLAGTLTEGGTLGSIAVTNANDFLYEKLTGKKLDATENTLSFTLGQQLAKVNLTFTVDYSDWKITKVNSSPTIRSATISPTAFTHAGTGSLSGNSVDLSFTGLPATPNATTANSEYLRIAPAEASTLTLTIPQGAVTLSGAALTVASHPTIQRTVTITKALEKGKIYTLTVKLKEPTESKKFAGSNIYWNGNELTFDAHGSNDNTKYQGVYFKWGSLIGISPAQTSGSNEFSSGTAANQTSGTTIYLKVNGDWVKTNVAYATSKGWISGSDWSDIPYQDDEKINTTNLDAHSLLVNPDFEHYKGDICNYINPAYRMLTRNELKALGIGDSGNGVYTGFTSSLITNQTADGKTALDQFGTFTGISGTTYYLPASGYRRGSSGALYYVGYSGDYWSGSASGGSRAYSLGFDSSAGMSSTTRDHGLPVRCVLQE
jgi:hypothetical protein